MTTPQISALPPAPSRNMTDAAFTAAADALLGALPTLVAETNIATAAVDANAAQVAADRTQTGADKTVTTSAAATAVAAAAQAAAVPVTPATSISNVTIVSSGDVAFTLVETGKAFGVGQDVKATSIADITRYMIGKVKSLVGQVLTVTVSGSGGSGAVSNWQIALSGPIAQTFAGGTTITGSNKQNVTAVLALDLDLTSADLFTKAIAANSTFTFSGAVASMAQAFLLQLTISSAAVPTWPASVTWGGATAPTLGNGRHQLTFLTLDGGTSWTGAVRAKAAG